MARNTREILQLGHLKRRHISEAVGVASSLTPPELAQARDAEVQRENRSRFAQLIADETDAAIEAGRRDDELLAAGVYPASADPAHVVGLDGATPDSETAGDGDSKRTDPNAS